MALRENGQEAANLATPAGLLALVYEYLVLTTVLAVLFAAGPFWNLHENAIGGFMISGVTCGIGAMIASLKAQRHRKAAMFLLGVIPLVVFGMLMFVNPMIQVINYKAGNLTSVLEALTTLVRRRM